MGKITEAADLVAARRKISQLKENAGLFVRISYTSKWTSENGDEFKFNSAPKREDIQSAAIDLRHFLANSSPLLMGRLVRYSRASGNFDIHKLDKFYSEWRKSTGDKRTNSTPLGIALNMNGKDLTLKQQIDLWMNGDLFHASNEKSQKISDMYFESFRATSWLVFVTTLQHLAMLLIYFDEHFLDDIKES